VIKQRLFGCAALGGALFLAGCGSGGGGGGFTPAPAPPPSALVCAGGASFSSFADTTVAAGKAAGAMVAGCTGPLSNVRWTQTAGPAVALVAAQTQAISFTPPSAGTYSFRVDFNDASGTAQSVSVTTAATAAAAGVTSYSDQAVREGGKVSLRAWPALAAGETQTWAQVDGPAVTLDSSGDPNRVLFTAPQVGADTGLRFRVTRTRAGGAVETDDVLVLVENHAQAPSGNAAYVFSDDHVSRVYAYRAAGPYAAALARCAYDTQLQWAGGGKNLCSLNTLPFLHRDSGGGVPTIEQVMNRVLVSHEWMGRNFEAFLQQNDATGDIRRLLNGVTAVVIGAHVRPSFYYALTGAIYLDADNFWLTPEERDVIDETPDFRSDFDRDLSYGGLWRYTRDNQSIFAAFPAGSRVSRDVPYLQFETAWLMYHELGHAGDFMPPGARAGVNSNLSAWDNIQPRFSGSALISDTLTAQSPLQSGEMRALAQVKFIEGPPADTDPARDARLYAGIPYGTLRLWTPQQVAGFFGPDRATDEYNYSTTREDLTMTFEEFMMYRNLGARRDVAITDKITASSTGSSILVRWGQRGRVGEASTRSRARFAVQNLAPWIDLAEVDNLPAPIPMRAGDSWNANLSLPAPLPVARAAAAPSAAERAADAELLRRALRRAGGGPGLPAR
jgi:hypothetical protein